MEFSNTLTIRRPPGEVFQFLANLENVPKWNYAIVETRKVSDGPVAIGSIYQQVRSVPQRSEESLEVVELEPDRRFAVRGDLGPFTGTLTYELDDVDGSTQLTNSARLQGRGAMKLAAPLAESRVRQAVASNLQVLKPMLESGSA